MLSIRSQLLFTACRPIYVAVTKLGEKQIDESRKNSSKYRPVVGNNINIRKILAKKSGPACKTKSNKKSRYEQKDMVASWKRKAPSEDELESSIIIENKRISNGTSTAITKEALVALNDIKSCFMGNAEINGKSIKERKPNTITLIDLCSSDEEEDNPSTRIPCDENKDPMNSAESPSIKPLSRKFLPKQTLCEALHLPRTLIDRLVIEQNSEKR